MKEIPLTQGKVAFVDDEDYEVVSAHKWYAKYHAPSDNWYACRAEKRRTIQMARFIMDAPDGTMVDHIDHDGLNNTKANLRLASRSENGRNRQTNRYGKTSRFKGVHWYDFHEKWKACIRVDGKLLFLGHYKSEEDAAIAYNEAAVKHFGEFALVNEVNRDR